MKKSIDDMLSVNSKIKHKVAVLVISCDNYADLWQPFFTLFRRYWPDCPFRVYLVSNNLDPEVKGAQTIAVGDDVSWSDNLRKALGLLNEDYVLLFLEDLFLHKPVPTAKVLEIIEWAVGKGANCLRLNPSPPPDKQINDIVGSVSSGSIYRTSTVMSLWKKEVLYDLLKPGENAWQFEINGSIRSNKYDGFYSATRLHFSIINSVIKSKWCKKALKHMRKHAVEFDLNRRRQMTFGEEMVYFFRRQRSRLFLVIPNSYRRTIKTYLTSNQL